MQCKLVQLSLRHEMEDVYKSDDVQGNKNAVVSVELV